MTIKSTLKLSKQGIKVADTWAASITKLRIQRCAPNTYYVDEDHFASWALDGYNEVTHELSEDIEFYATHAEAVAAIPAFLARNNLAQIEEEPEPTSDPEAGDYGKYLDQQFWGDH